jgi:hypothetical protein
MRTAGAIRRFFVLCVSRNPDVDPEFLVSCEVLQPLRETGRLLFLLRAAGILGSVREGCMAGEKTKEELEIEKMELENQKARLEIKDKDTERWHADFLKPISAAVIAALFTALSSIAISAYNSSQSITLEDRKLRNELLIKFVAVGDTKISARNLKFLKDTKLAGDIVIPPEYLTPEGAPVLASPVAAEIRHRTILPNKCDLKFTFVDGSKVVLADDWENKNIVVVDIPQLKNLGVTKVKINNVAAKALKTAFSEIEEAGLLDRIISYDGSFVARTIRGSTTILSNHSCGLAFDMNATANRIGTSGAPAGTNGSLTDLIPIFERNGFVWGGYFPTPDPMHFEYQPQDSSLETSEGD